MIFPAASTKPVGAGKHGEVRGRRSISIRRRRHGLGRLTEERSANRNFGNRRPSGADHDQQQPGLAGLDATLASRSRRASYPRSRLNYSRWCRPALKPLFSRAVRTAPEASSRSATFHFPCRPTVSPACSRWPPSKRASSDGWPPNSRPPASRGRSPLKSNQRGVAVTIMVIPTTFQKLRRVAVTMFRWMLPTRSPMATDGKIGSSGRSAKGLFLLVHNCE
jgi:hypothetical protein